MRTILLMLTVVALAAPAQAAPKTGTRDVTVEYCRTIVGKEQSDGEGRGGAGRLQAQRFAECMMGMPH